MILRAAPERSIAHQALVVILFLFAVGLVTVANYFTLAAQSEGMKNDDFMAGWVGGRALVLGLNPYDAEAWCSLRSAYGSTWIPDPSSLWPLWTLLLFIPFSFLEVQIAAAFWMTLCETLLIVGVFLFTEALGWEKREVFPFLLGVTLFRPVFPAISNGQLSPIVFFLLATAYALYVQDKPLTAGLILALIVIKPNLTAILLLATGLIFLMRQDWRALVGLIGGGVILLIISWLIQPGWVFQWLLTARKGEVIYATPTLWGITHDVGRGNLWPYSAIVLGGVFCLALLIFLYRQQEEMWGLGFSLSIIASVFLTPYLWAYGQIVLLLPTIFALHWGLDSEVGPRWVWWAGWGMSTVISSWLLFLIALRRNVDTLSGLMPLIALVYLIIAWRARKKGVGI